MRKQLAFVLAAVLSTTVFCIAQNLPIVHADIPFSFIAEGKTLPAGTYSFMEGDNPSVIMVRNTKTGDAVIANVITRLGSGADKESDVVFDVTGNDHILSEIHFEGVDGFLVKATPGKHTHVHVKGRK